MKYRDIFNSKIEEIFSSTEKYFKEAEDYCEDLKIEDIESLEDIKPILNRLNILESRTKSVKVNFKLDSIKMRINEEFTSRLDTVELERNNMMLSLRNKIEHAMDIKRSEIQDLNKDIRSKNEILRNEIDSINSKYKQLEIKRQRLLEYSQEILQLCSDYGIKVSDININNDMFTVEELSLFYEQFYSFISSRVKINNNPVEWLRNKLDNNATALLAVLIFTIAMSFTKLLDIMSIGMLFYIIYNQSIQESIVKKYTIMAGLAFNINPMELGVLKEIPEDMIEQELSEEIDIDNEPEFKMLLEEVNKSMDTITDDDIRDDMSKVISSFTMEYPIMETELKDLLDAIRDRKESIYIEIKEVRDKVLIKEEELKSNIKLLGSEFSESGIISTEIKLGMDPSTLIYETLDLGTKNLIFKEKGNDPEELDKFIKVLLANYYCNVRPGYFDVTIYDPNGMGRSMAGFYSVDMEQVFNISSDSLDVILKDLREHTDKVIKTTKGKSINEYNEEVSKDGRICLNYKLLLVLSQPKTVEENEELMSFIEYSADLGVFVWMVTDTEFKNTKIFNKPFEGIRQPIDIDPYDFPEKVMSNLFLAFQDLSSPALMWEEFLDRTIPDDKVWTYCADEFIDIDPGFEDGDPSKSKGYTLGNTGDVHAIGVGGTGAGKSIFINNIIANICTKYHPNSVSLWLVDFKGSEFNFYLKKPDIGQPYMLPHIDACLCTSDPDYSVSFFKALREESDGRYKFLKSVGFKNMFDYNKEMRKKGTPEKCLKRILVFGDEFQIIFEKTDAKAQAELKGHITQIAKVARACGIHLLFFSQSMVGTISADIMSQFTLRFALRCPMEVSLAIMGTKFSGDIREKNGYLYVSSIDDKKKELQKRYRTPFITDGTLRERIYLLAEKSVKENYIRDKEAIEYDELTVHDINEIDDIYNNVISKEDMKDLFILGERMVYSNKGRRKNVKMFREDNQHIFSVFSNMTDVVMFFNTIMRNISFHDNTQMIFNTQVKDMGYLCELDKYIDDDNVYFNSKGQTPSTLLPVFENIVENRKKVEDSETLKPLYVILLGWDKALGFGIDSNYKITERYSTMLQICASLHVHFIFICNAQGDIPKAVVMSTRNRIAGKCDEKSSTTLLDSSAAYKNYEQEDGYMFISNSGVVERLKIYQSDITRKIKDRELQI